MPITNQNSHKAAIICVGTEITSGEITNTNSAKVAMQLTEFGIECDLHVAVPDQRDTIHWAIEHAVSSHGIVIIIGGLGPTSDDFTREVIATSATKKLIWNEDNWSAIKRRLDSVGAPHAESNKQQAYFPEGATIFQNNHGTAAAFSIRSGKSLILALPGPPKELEGLLDDSVREYLSSLAPKEKNTIPFRWRCLGLSESKLGELVEEALKGSSFLTGYRSFLPYVDVKVWVSENRKQEFEDTWRVKLETAIAAWLVSRDNEDIAETFRQLCPLATPVYVLDRATQGYLSQRIYASTPVAGCQLTVLSTDYSTPIPPFESGCMVATVSVNFETGAWQLSLTGGGPHKNFAEESRYKGKAHADRLKAYIGEKVLILLSEWFKTI